MPGGARRRSASVLLDADRDELYFPYVAEDKPEIAERLVGLRGSLRIAASPWCGCKAESRSVSTTRNQICFYGGVD